MDLSNIDPTTALTILGTAAGSMKLVEKLIGPTADYMGGGIRNWTEKRVHNAGKILDSATKKLGDKIHEEGRIPPKVLKHILEEGSYSEDRITLEYFGGVLASSRSEVSRDDRGVTFTTTLARLSTYQIRSHFLFYQLAKSLFDGSGKSVTRGGDRSSLYMSIPWSSYYTAMEFSESENPSNIKDHVISGLIQELLIGEEVEDAEDAIVLAPSSLGTDLFLWAHGKGHLNRSEFFNPAVTFPVETNIPILHGAKAYQDYRMYGDYTL